MFVLVSQHDKVTAFLQLPAAGEKETLPLCFGPPCSAGTLLTIQSPACLSSYDSKSLQKAIFFFFGGGLMSVLGKATAMYTMGEVWRGKVFQHTPSVGEGFTISITRNRMS